jgi:glutamate racemase
MGLRGILEAGYRKLNAGCRILYAVMISRQCPADTMPAVPNSQFPISLGLFDSGVGGLSVARELMRQAPAQPIIYFADQVHAPYGQRSLAEIRSLADGIARFLLLEGARIIVVACNTASAAALRSLRDCFPDTPFVGMEPAIKPAAEHTRTGHVGVIATSATFQGELFASLMDRFAAGITVHTQACPELVPLVEAGELCSQRTLNALRSYLAPLMDAGIDELVLGCTHYPFLRPLIEEVVGAGVEIVDPAPAVARQTVRVLAGRGWLAEGNQTLARRFYTSGSPERFRIALGELLGLDAEVEQGRWDESGILQSLGTQQR